MYGYPRYFDYFKKEEPKIKNEYDDGRVEVNIIENNADKDYYPQNGWGEPAELSQEAGLRQNMPEIKEIPSEMPSAYESFISTPASAYTNSPASVQANVPARVSESAPVSTPASAAVSTTASTPDSTTASSPADASAKSSDDIPVRAPEPANIPEDAKGGALSVPPVQSLYNAPGGYGVPGWLRDWYPERKEKSSVVINIICSDYRIDRD